jgi:hypothetical protein
MLSVIESPSTAVASVVNTARAKLRCGRKNPGGGIIIGGGNIGPGGYIPGGGTIGPPNDGGGAPAPDGAPGAPGGGGGENAPRGSIGPCPGGG